MLPPVPENKNGSTCFSPLESIRYSYVGGQFDLYSSIKLFKCSLIRSLCYLTSNFNLLSLPISGLSICKPSSISYLFLFLRLFFNFLSFNFNFGSFLVSTFFLICLILSYCFYDFVSFSFYYCLN